MKATSFLLILLALLTAGAVACDHDDDVGHDWNIDPGEPQPDPDRGQWSFVSADGRPGADSQSSEGDGSDAPAEENNADGGSGDRTVEEGDIYQVLAGERLILNLNAYRGFQVIDFGDPSAPEIIGDLQVAGAPVEMYQVGDRVYALVNGWRGYYGSRDDVRPETFEGGLVLAIDVSDPTNPRVTGRAEIEGDIITSRLTRGGGQEALFVAATDSSTTYVRSFQVSSAGALTRKSEIDLGGHVTDIQATPTRLMVARHDWLDGMGSQVALIDISDPAGEMVEGATVRARGVVESKTNMDLDGDVLRVVSGNDWSSDTNTNHVETFDASDIDTLAPIDHATFGDGEDLYATIFLGPKAFFVTYRRVDPFHAFAIDAAGMITEESAFVVSGWNDFFKAVSDDTRLLGVGKNDEVGQRLAVSLYDITDLTNPNPLITRAEVELAWSSSEASWDDRAFTVLEDATTATAPGGEPEAGLVLLPFSGWNEEEGQYQSGVQIFTFSDTTLTRRGVMDHDTPVRRSFLADAAAHTAGNLSEVELSLFDASDPDAPGELGRVELAPNYSDFLTFGDWGVRRHSFVEYYYWWGSRAQELPEDRLEIVSLSGDVDQDAAAATIAIPASASIYPSGDLLAVAWHDPKEPDAEDDRLHTNVQVWDLSDPGAPVEAGALTTTALPYLSGYGYWDYGYGPEAPGPATDGVAQLNGYGWGGVHVVGQALAVVEPIAEQQLEGTEHVRYIYPVQRDYDECWDDASGAAQSCTYLTGGVQCRSLERVDGTTSPEVCSGAIYRCAWTPGEDADCEEVDPDTIEVEEQTYEWERYRYWQHYDVHVVDLSDPASPTLATTVSMADDEEAVGVVVDGARLFVSYKKPLDIEGDGRPFARYYFRAIDLTTPSQPAVSLGVNVPGQLVAVDGQAVITRDFLWGENVIETSIHKLSWRGAFAYLEGTRRFVDRYVQQLQFDGAGHVLVTHRGAWWGYDSVSPADTGVVVSPDGGAVGEGVTTPDDEGGEDEPREPELPEHTLQLSVLDVDAADFAELSVTSIDDWASLRAAVAGRALFTVPGGVLVVNLDDATAPHAQAYFPLRGWPSQVTLEGREVFMPAGRFGVYRFDLDVFNLLAQE